MKNKFFHSATFFVFILLLNVFSLKGQVTIDFETGAVSTGSYLHLI